MKHLIEKFNLPKYLKGDSFSADSKRISEKIRGKNKEFSSKEDIDSEQDLLGRLRDAQEYVKAESEAKETKQLAEGGVPAGGAVQAGAAGVGMLADLIPTDPSVSGRVNKGAMTAKGAAKGAATGAAMGAMAGPVGAGIGAGVGALAGGAKSFIEAGKINEAADKASDLEARTLLGSVDSKLAVGGYTNPPPDEVTPLKDLYTPASMSTNSLLPDSVINYASDKKKAAAINETTVREKNSPPQATSNNEFDFAKDLATDSSSRLYGSKNKLRDIATSAKAYDTPGYQEINQSSGADADILEKPIAQDEMSKGEILKQKYSNFKEKNPTLGADLLRAAPLAANALQLAKMSKPGHEGYDRITSKYKKTLVDEEALQNKVKGAGANTRAAILGASGGSGASAQANLLASQLQETKGLSDAYLNAENVNRGESNTAQQFDLNVQNANLGQSNREIVANAQNQGNFDTQKSKLQGALAEDIGKLGKEELFKKYPELMGLDFDSLGKFIKAQKGTKTA